MSLTTILFALLAAVVGCSAIAVVLTQNIVRACVWLLFTLGGLSGLYFLLGAEFVAATQLLIYVGGTMVLVVFGIMLTGSEAFKGLRPKPWERQLTVFVGVVLFVTLVNLFASSFGDATKRPPVPDPEQLPTVTHLGTSLLGVREASPDITNRARLAYLLPFEIISVHLLVVLIGAAYLARTKRAVTEPIRTPDTRTQRQYTAQLRQDNPTDQAPTLLGDNAGGQNLR